MPDQPDPRAHVSLCMACTCKPGVDIHMLTGYCLTKCRCSNCGRLDDLAMCTVPATYAPQRLT
jgi:hypothetical protein